MNMNLLHNFLKSTAHCNHNISKISVILVVSIFILFISCSINNSTSGITTIPNEVEATVIYEDSTAAKDIVVSLRSIIITADGDSITSINNAITDKNGKCK